MVIGMSGVGRPHSKKKTKKQKNIQTNKCARDGVFCLILVKHDVYVLLHCPVIGEISAADIGQSDERIML